VKNTSALTRHFFNALLPTTTFQTRVADKRILDRGVSIMALLAWCGCDGQKR